MRKTDQAELAGAIAYALTTRMIIDMPTARAAVDAAMKDVTEARPETDQPASAHDPVYTYKCQPQNVPAWRMGEACSTAAKDPKCGDYIDRGLILLRELEARGFGVVPLGDVEGKRAEPTSAHDPICKAEPDIATPLHIAIEFLEDFGHADEAKWLRYLRAENERLTALTNSARKDSASSELAELRDTYAELQHLHATFMATNKKTSDAAGRRIAELEAALKDSASSSEADLAASLNMEALLEAAFREGHTSGDAGQRVNMAWKDSEARFNGLRYCPDPVPAQAVVDEAMVDRGAAGMYGAKWNSPKEEERPGEKMKDVWRKYARAALEAAISQPTKSGA